MPARPLPGGGPPAAAPRELHDIWKALQQIAEEEEPRFREKNVVEHFGAGAEGMKDVERWLHIFQRRLDPAHTFHFPAHHHRYRGHALIPRLWPDGMSWEAFHEETWFRASLPRQASEQALREALDELLDGR